MVGLLFDRGPLNGEEWCGACIIVGPASETSIVAHAKNDRALKMCTTKWLWFGSLTVLVYQ